MLIQIVKIIVITITFSLQINANCYSSERCVVKILSHLNQKNVNSIMINSSDNYQYIPSLDCYIVNNCNNFLKDQVRNTKNIVYTEPIYLIPILTDPFLHMQWGLHNTGQNGLMDADIDAPEAWLIERGSKDVVIAVIDTGIDYTHPDLADNIWLNSDEIPDNQVDDDNNGYVDDIIGWDFVDLQTFDDSDDCLVPDNDPMDRHGHGTQIAGIIGAVSNNNEGISGIAGTCQIMPVRAGFKTETGGGFLESIDAAQAIVYAVDNGARIINLSWGDLVRSFIIDDAIQYATDRNVLVCAASGNDNSNQLIFPAASRNLSIISVGATDGFDLKSFFSNFGNWVHVSAPGSAIFTTSLNHSYESVNGTSMACAHVSGAAALIYSHFPDISVRSIKSRLLRSADHIDNLEGKNLTSGRINIYRALKEIYGYPIIISISHEQVHPNDHLTIYGDTFGDNGEVRFSPGVNAEIISWDSNIITCTVPETAQSGQLTVYCSQGEDAYDVDVFIKYYDVQQSQITNIIKGKPCNWKDDDQTWSYDLPFGFQFFGITYHQVYIGSNGFLDFNNDNPSASNSSQAFMKRSMIALLWDDLRTDGFGQSNEDIYIYSDDSESISFQWIAEQYDSEDPIIAEVILYKEGLIRFNYQIARNAELSPCIGISAGDMKSFELLDILSFQDWNQSILFTPYQHLFSVQLDKGWNLISFPLLIDHIPINNILGEVSNFIEIIWGYNDQCWTAYIPGMQEMSDLQFFKNGRGYWIKSMSNNLNIQCQGASKHKLDYQLNHGWNLLGTGSLSPVKISNLVNSYCRDLYIFENKYWNHITFSENANAHTDQILSFDIGFWLKCSD